MKYLCNSFKFWFVLSIVILSLSDLMKFDLI